MWKFRSSKSSQKCLKVVDRGAGLILRRVSIDETGSYKAQKKSWCRR
jgi:hypothetical protein